MSIIPFQWLDPASILPSHVRPWKTTQIHFQNFFCWPLDISLRPRGPPFNTQTFQQDFLSLTKSTNIHATFEGLLCGRPCVSPLYNATDIDSVYQHTCWETETLENNQLSIPSWIKYVKSESVLSLPLWHSCCLFLPLPLASIFLLSPSHGSKHNIGIPKPRTLHVSCCTHVLGMAEGPWGSPERDTISCFPLVSGTDVVSGSWLSSTGPWELVWGGRDQR